MTFPCFYLKKPKCRRPYCYGKGKVILIMILFFLTVFPFISSPFGGARCWWTLLDCVGSYRKDNNGVKFVLCQPSPIFQSRLPWGSWLWGLFWAPLWSWRYNFWQLENINVVSLLYLAVVHHGEAVSFETGNRP